MFLLKGTRLRKKLLIYSFAHPDESHYVRELAACIDEDPGNLSRELTSLEKEGLFASSRRGNLKLYSLNKSYPLYNELKKMISKTVGIEGSLKEIAEKYRGIVMSFIYGSYAKNSEKAGSDIDVVFVGSAEEDTVASDIRDLEKELSREINYTMYTEKEFDRERRKSGGFLDLVLKGKIIVLKGRESA